MDGCVFFWFLEFESLIQIMFFFCGMKRTNSSEDVGSTSLVGATQGAI